MSAALALAALVEAGAHLGADDSGLYIDAPSPLSAPMLELVRAEKPALLVVASGAWRVELAGWSGDLLDLWAERAAVMQHDGGLQLELAEQAAFLDVRARALAPAAELVAAIAAAGLGPVLLVGLRPAALPVEGFEVT